MSNWVSAVIAGLALAVATATFVAARLEKRQESRTARLTAYFHWNREKSRVDLPDRKIHVGYNLVIWNQGPAMARDIRLEVRRPRDSKIINLASVDEDEFPLSIIDRDGRYPVQFAPELEEFFNSNEHPIVRRFEVTLRWTDGRGEQERIVPLRRGQVRQ
ncbi:hypothetical protein ACFFX1_37305 [Dactylosporangium sucinum]|uniref:Uncharacterized protein n=1 Tax=Dactylosporangium sucinum TaxID=1424081 RepID=A0A917UGI2_9ACTN|nr:hypothetical protein [Dactylosporangium sucinum]GGM90631.1 hypothetical protein GCM10007977_110790 [Dactylosporangium sucinum]